MKNESFLTTLQLQDEHSGYKFHAATCTDGEAAPFRYEYVTWKGPEDPVAVTFTKIGELDEGLDYRHLDEYLKGIPMVIPSIDHMSEPRFSCRVWFKEALRQLHDAEMFVRCPSVELLEDELRTRAIAAEYTNQLPQIRSTARADAWDY